MAENADTTAIEELQRDLARIKTVSLGRLGERGYQLLRKEVPYRTGNLRQGVAAPVIQGDTATLTVSARSARRGPRSAVLHLRSGKTRNVELRPTAAYNYAGAVAQGRPAMRAQEARALLIPVDAAPTNEAYIEMGGQFYIMRKSAAASEPNPFHERAGRQLEIEGVAITEASIQKVLNG